jgi:hypothetical protein
MAELEEQPRLIMRLLGACLEVADYQVRNKVAPEKAQRFIDKTCESNGDVIRKRIDLIKEKLKP